MGVALELGVAEDVGLRVGLALGVGVGLGVRVALEVGVRVGVRVPVGDKVGVGVRVPVGAGPAAAQEASQTRASRSCRRGSGPSTGIDTSTGGAELTRAVSVRLATP